MMKKIIFVLLILIASPAEAMIILDDTNDTMQAVLGASVTTNQFNCASSWRDVTTSAYTPGKTVTNTNNTTDVNLVGSPGASTQRVIDFVSCYNNDTVSQTLTVKFDDNSTEYILWKGILNPQERLEYVDGKGFNTYTSTGGVKTQSTTGMVTSTTENIVVLSSDVADSSGANTLTDLTGMSFSVTSGNVYWFELTVPYTSAATTTGSRWTVNGPAVTYLEYGSRYTLTATTLTSNYCSTIQCPSGANATSLADGNVAEVWGIIKPSADGTVQVQFATEIDLSAVTAKAGAILRWRQVA